MLADVLSTVPTSRHLIAELTARPVPIVELVCKVAAAPSKREACELLSAGAITVNGRKVIESELLDASDLLHVKLAAIRRGRKTWFFGIWE